MPRQAIKQAEHIDCPLAPDSDDEPQPEFSLIDKTFLDDDVSTIRYDVRCDCGEDAVVEVSSEGTSASDEITYENASWNQSDEDDE